VAVGNPLTAASVSTVDCDGAAVGPDAPTCSIMQLALPGRRLQVARGGAIRAWSVRGATGDIALQILRRRGDGYLQVQRSQLETARGPGLHRFRTALKVEPGDRIALALLPGAGAGLGPAGDGATTARWFGPVGTLRRPTRPPGTGLDRELLLRAELEVGGVPPAPRSISGAAARNLPSGRLIAASETNLPDGRHVRVELSEVGGLVVIDLIRAGVRRARTVVPDLKAGGTLVELKAFESKGNDSQLNVSWRNPSTSKVIDHYFGLGPYAFEFYS
jgi:hypothetical protein